MDFGRLSEDFVISSWQNAFIFDLDGVVVDSMPLHAEAWRVYLERLGIVIQDLDDRMHGGRNDELVRAFIAADLPPQAVFEHGAAKERLWREMMLPRLEEHIVPGVRAFLGRLAGAPCAVASNAEPANIEFVLEGADLRRHFQVVVDGHQVSRPKPWPDIYLKAAELLGAAPEDCIVFEDSPTGIEAARGAGCRVIGVGTHTMDLPGTELVIRDFCDAALEKANLGRNGNRET
jgi:beta-phosphoglucomutase family hydrolase